MSLLDALLLDPAPFNVWVAIRSDQLKGSGTLTDPFHGGDGKLDDLLKALPDNTRVHLGPGTFVTQGYREGVSGSDWWPRPGMKIIGSGVGITTVQISGASPQAYHHIAIGRSRLDSLDTTQQSPVEISDVTIDCNFQSVTQLSCAAIQVSGTHVRIRNVFAKNWGNRSSGRRAVISVTTFAARNNAGTFAAVTPVDPVIEDCIVADSSSNYIGDSQNPDQQQMVALDASGFGDDDASNSDRTYIQGFGLGPVIRNCFVEGKVDTEKKPRSYPKITGVAMELCYGGIVERNQFHNLWIGGPYQLQLVGAGQPKRNTRELIVRSNTYKNVVGGVVCWQLEPYGATIAMTGTAYSGGNLTVRPDKKPAGSQDYPPHQLFVGIRVKILGLTGYTTHQIVAVDSTTTFQVAGPSIQTEVQGTYQLMFGVAKLVVENNHFELAAFVSAEGGIPSLEDGSPGKPIGIFLSDPASPTEGVYVYGEVLIRGNKFRYLNGQSNSAFTGTAVQAASIEKGMIRDNYMETIPADPLQIWRCSQFGFLNNRKPEGTLVLGLDNATGHRGDEIQTAAEDAFVLAFLEKP